MFSTLVHSVLGIALFVLILVPPAVQGQDIKVTLLGTGCPPPVMHWFGPSSLVETGGQNGSADAEHRRQETFQTTLDRRLWGRCPAILLTVCGRRYRLIAEDLGIRVRARPRWLNTS